MGSLIRFAGEIIIAIAIICFASILFGFSFIPRVGTTMGVIVGIAISFGIAVPGILIYSYGQIVDDVHEIRQDVHLSQDSLRESINDLKQSTENLQQLAERMPYISGDVHLLTKAVISKFDNSLRPEETNKES